MSKLLKSIIFLFTIYIFVRKKSYEANFEIFVHQKPKIVWKFLIDFSNIQKLNPRIVSWVYENKESCEDKFNENFDKVHQRDKCVETFNEKTDEHCDSYKNRDEQKNEYRSKNSKNFRKNYELFYKNYNNPHKTYENLYKKDENSQKNLVHGSYEIISYEGMIGQSFLGINENHGKIKFLEIEKDRKFQIEEIYITFSFWKLLTIENWTEMTIESYEEKYSVFKQKVGVKCPLVFYFLCVYETNVNRKDFLENLQNYFKS